jgi:ankyrin repeat protein
MDYEAIAQQYIAATRGGNTFDVEEALRGKDPARIFRAIPNKVELLFEAASNGFVGFLKKSLQYFDPTTLKQKNKDDKTLLQVAIENEQLGAAEVLFLETRKITKASEYQDRFFSAIKLDRDDIVLYMLTYLSQNIESLLSTYSLDGNLAIHLAAQYGSHKSLKRLVDTYYIAHQEPINMKNSKGDTPLHIAARDNQLACVKILLESELVNTFIQNSKGFTPWKELKEKEKNERTVR